MPRHVPGGPSPVRWSQADPVGELELPADWRRWLEQPEGYLRHLH